MKKLAHIWHYAKWKMEPLVKERREWRVRVEEAARECRLPLIYDKHTGDIRLEESLDSLKNEPGNFDMIDEEYLK